MTNISMTTGSRNRKTGPMPVTTSDRASCPPTCPLMGGGCYAEHVPRLHWHWNQISQRDTDTKKTLATIRKLPYDQLWRYGQAGDLPGNGIHINEYQMMKLVDANAGRQGFAYTHKPVLHKRDPPPKYILKNRRLIKYANDNGFTINLSANNLAEADELLDLDIGPVVCIVPSLDDEWWEQYPNYRISTPRGRSCHLCPESLDSSVTCTVCTVCQHQPKTVNGYPTRGVVLFPAHGTRKKLVSELSKGITK